MLVKTIVKVMRTTDRTNGPKRWTWWCSSKWEQNTYAYICFWQASTSELFFNRADRLTIAHSEFHVERKGKRKRWRGVVLAYIRTNIKLEASGTMRKSTIEIYECVFVCEFHLSNSKYDFAKPSMNISE